MAGVQPLTEQDTVLCDQDAQRQHLLVSRASQITSFQCELAEICARLSVSADALATKMQKSDQSRKNEERFCLNNKQFWSLLRSFSQQIETPSHSLELASAKGKSGQSNFCRRIPHCWKIFAVLVLWSSTGESCRFVGAFLVQVR